MYTLQAKYSFETLNKIKKKNYFWVGMKIDFFSNSNLILRKLLKSANIHSNFTMKIVKKKTLLMSDFK